MEKLNKVFRINPLYEADSYKVGHKKMLVDGIKREAWNWIPRNLKYMHKSIDSIMSAGYQLSLRYLHSHFQELFFDQPVEVAIKFGKDMSLHLSSDFNADHFIALHKLGYLPIHIQTLDEGTLTKANIPHVQGINTHDDYAWLNLYLETMISKISWQFPVVATMGYKFKENAFKSVMATDPENIGAAEFMCHDFHSRGGNPFTSVVVSLGHLFSNSGGDTLNAIPASRYYYDVGENEMPIFSVNASEHSVTSIGIFYYEKQLKNGELNDVIKDYYDFEAPSEGSVENPDYRAIAELLNLQAWLKKFPTGILSYVADTFDFWKLLSMILPRLKAEIMSREGKLVLRPDSGDPVDIICGTIKKGNHGDIDEKLGAVEVLHGLFPGDVSSLGFKTLDSHIGLIYGDSINLDRQVEIYERLIDKKFATSSVVLGIGSFSYVYMTRDQAGYAAKGSWFEMENGDTFNIYKDPATDDGTKKSLKGFQFVYFDEDGVIQTEGEVTEQKAFSEDNLLKTRYKDGKFYNQVTLGEVRNKLKFK